MWESVLRGKRDLRRTDRRWKDKSGREIGPTRGQKPDFGGRGVDRGTCSLNAWGDKPPRGGGKKRFNSREGVKDNPRQNACEGEATKKGEKVNKKGRGERKRMGVKRNAEWGPSVGKKNSGASLESKDDTGEIKGTDLKGKKNNVGKFEDTGKERRGSHNHKR